MSTSKSPALKVELWAVDRLEPYARNAKKHDADQVARLAAVIERQGWDQPIVVWPIPGTDRGSIIKGHGRRLAALSLGMTHVPVIVRDDLTKQEADAARIADNSAASTAYDTRVLMEESRRLMADFDLGALDFGFNDKDTALLLEKIDVPDVSAIMTDTETEIEKQKTEDAERVERVDAEQVSIGEVFGIKTMSREQARVINRALALSEDEMPKHGGGFDAFVAWLDEQVA